MKGCYVTTAVLIGILCSTAVFAQVTPNVWSSRIYQREMLRIAGNGAVNRALLNKRRSANNSVAAPKAKKILTATGATAFKFSSQYILPGMALKEFKGSQQEKAAVADEIKGFIDSYKSTARQDGFAANDLAFSLTYHFFSSFFAHTNISCNGNGASSCRMANKLTQTDFKTDSAVVEQFRAVLLANPNTAKMTDYDKQLMAESIAVKTMLFNKKWNEVIDGKNDASLLEIKREADKNLEDLLGSTADKISLSQEGINIK